MIKINVPNKKKFENALKKHGKEVEVEVAKIVKMTAQQAQATAISKAPVDNGTLRQSIKAEPITDLSWKVTAYEPYAAYQEFGTRGKVNVPIEFTELADKARRLPKGTFKGGLNSIKKWCINKGIDVKFAYIIFINILNKGLKPQPFMYPSFVEARRNFNRDLKNLFKDLAKKFNNG